jgi:hypothetical protein
MRPQGLTTAKTVAKVSVVSDAAGGKQERGTRGPLVWGAPSWAAAHPCYEHRCPDPTPPPGFLSRMFWYAGRERSDSATVPGRLRSTSSCARQQGSTGLDYSSPITSTPMADPAARR